MRYTHASSGLILATALLAAVGVCAAKGHAAENTTMSEQHSQPGAEYVDVKAAMDYAGFTPGETTLVGLTFTVADDWHTYWPGLSDTGFGITLRTEAPEGLTVGDPIWPTPHRYLLPGDILDHVYEHEFTVLIPMTLDEGFEAGVPMTITTHISYLVCKEMCLPGAISIEYGGYSLDADLERPEMPGHFKRIQSEYDKRAMPLKSERPDARVSVSEDRATIFVPGAKKLMFYPAQDCVDLKSLIADGESSSDTLTLLTEPSADAMLEGRLEVIDAEGASRAYTVRVPAIAE